MKKNNILLIVNDLNLPELLKEESNITFLFPLEEYSIGFNKTFKLEDIKINAFIYVNRIMDNKSIIAFKEVLKNLPPNILGIVFDDLGVLNILEELNSPLVKILFLNHFNCNYASINAYLEYVDSVVVSPDITKEETLEILTKVIKPVVLYTFGYVNIMYSRRVLITNYNKHFNKNVSKEATLEDEITHQKLKIVENKYGTVIYTNEPFNALELRKENNVLYNLINTVFLNTDQILNIIKSDDNLENIYPYKYLSTKKTTVKIKEEEK